MRSVCSFHKMHNLSELISVRMDDILAELDRARRDPAQAEAAEAALLTVERLAPVAMLQRINSRL